jgi:branched-chain amino acid transport system permease protein
MLGRTFTVAREDEELAQALAVDTARLRRFAFVLSGTLGGLAGSLNVLLLGSISPTDAGFELIVVALTMVILGGFHSWVGALLGAMLVQWMPIALQSLASWWNIIYGVLVVVVAIYAPAGILGLLQRLAGAIGRARAARRRPEPVREREVEPVA